MNILVEFYFRPISLTYPEYCMRDGISRKPPILQVDSKGGIRSMYPALLGATYGNLLRLKTCEPTASHSKLPSD